MIESSEEARYLEIDYQNFLNQLSMLFLFYRASSLDCLSLSSVEFNMMGRLLHSCACLCFATCGVHSMFPVSIYLNPGPFSLFYREWSHHFLV